MSKKNIRCIIDRISPLMKEHGFRLETMDDDCCQFYNASMNETRILIKNHKAGFFDYQAVMARSFNPFPEDRAQYYNLIKQLSRITSNKQVDDFIRIFEKYLVEILFPAYEEAYIHPKTIYPSIEDERMFYDYSDVYVNRFKELVNRTEMKEDVIKTIVGLFVSLQKSLTPLDRDALLNLSGGITHLMSLEYYVKPFWDEGLKGCILSDDNHDTIGIRPVVVAYNLLQNYDAKEISRILYEFDL